MIEKDFTLMGRHVELRPLSLADENALIEAASDGELWNLQFTSVPNADSTKEYIEYALQSKSRGEQYPFVVLHAGKIVGCTRYYDISSQNRNLAIGYTWYAKAVQRTAVNTETKLLLLTHAFETLDCISVAFHTDHLNERSQMAITRLGAKKEGILRNHKIMPDGRIRHTWCYSIIDSEWPTVRERLTRRLAA